MTAVVNVQKQDGNSQHIIREILNDYLDFHVDKLTFDDKQNLIRRVVKEVRVYDDRMDIFTF